MKRSMLARWVIPLLALMSGGVSGQSRILVRTPAELEGVVRSLRPGDTAVLANGMWRDFEILFQGAGEPGRPITLTAESPGGVVLSGRSRLRMVGRHLVVANLVFRDGYSPGGEVIAFRRNREQRAEHSRVTGVVIDGFSKPDRRESDHWVALYGHHNRFDHSHVAGKTNAGATLVVVRDAEQGLENHHRIDHNFFGHRPNLGANGGETIRVGTSHDSLSDSHTLVERNWFEHCDGEVEIVSNKSGANTYRGNVFFESAGALVLRHGDGNLVEDNVFIGNGKAHTGGVRVINRRQTVRNNYMESLAGEGFASALTVMFGVPDSPLNRYVQVDGATIERNTIVDATSLFLGAGFDAERTARPINSHMTANLIVNRNAHDPIRVGGDISGLTLSNNVQSPAAGQRSGIRSARVDLHRSANGLLAVEGLDRIGARALRPVAREETGVAWYPKDRSVAQLDQGREIPVPPVDDGLLAAAQRAEPGDRLMLAPGRHSVDRVLTIDRPLTLQGPSDRSALVVFSGRSLFEIERGGSLRLSRLTVSGENAPDNAGNAVIRTRDGSGAANFALIIEDSVFADLDTNQSFDVFSAGKGTMADRVVLRRVEARAVSGEVVSADAETDDLGTYNIERLEVADSTFRDVGGPAINIYRGGNDESTFGPRLLVTGTTFERVGRAKSNATDASLQLHGVRRAEIREGRLIDSAGLRFVRPAGEATLIWEDMRLVRTPEPQDLQQAAKVR